jgi:predicted MFS family arabinose efflux permease
MPVHSSKDNPKARRRKAMTAGLPAGFAAVTLGKFLSNVAFRLVFPFLPRIASGLGVSLATMGTALAVRDLAGLTNPALGRAADRRGHGRAMVLGLAGLAAALAIQGVSDGIVLFTVSLIAISIAKALFDVASAAWVGDAVPFTRRGRAIGLLETSWAAAFVVGMPIAALLIRAGTWRTPFIVMAGVCAVMAVALDGGVVSTTRERRALAKFTWTAPKRAAVTTFAIMGIGHSMMLVTFASWLEDEHGVSIAGLGLTATVIGIAELAGSASSAVVSDRLGLGRSLRVALLAGAAASASLLVGSQAFVLALATMALYFIVVEYAIVTLLSLCSELDLQARGSMMGMAFAAFAIGHAVGAVAGTRIYESWGMTENVLFMGLAFAIAWVPARLVGDAAEPAPDLGASS